MISHSLCTAIPNPWEKQVGKAMAIYCNQRNTNFDNFWSFYWPLTDTNDNYTSFFALLKKLKQKGEVALQWDEGSLGWNSEYNREWKSEMRLLQMWAHCAWTYTRKLQCTTGHWTPKVLLFSRVWTEAKCYFCAGVSGYCAAALSVTEPWELILSLPEADTLISTYLFTSAERFSDHCWSWWEIHWFGQKYQNSHAYLFLTSSVTLRHS